MLELARRAVEAGAQLVLGHHPHVPYAVEAHGDGLIAPSLGNFVFRQRFQFWTQRSFALAVEIRREGERAVLGGVRCLPVRADFQPFFLDRGEEYETIMQRVKGNVHLVDQ